jgi:hypothetical protein
METHKEMVMRRSAAVMRARVAEKVPSHFLVGLDEKFGMTKKELAPLLGFTVGRYSPYVKSGECPIFVREAADKLLADRGLPPIKHVNGAAPRKPNIGPLKIERPPKGAHIVEQVPSGFLIGLEEKLGVMTKEIQTLLGVKSGQWHTWKKRGHCPSWVRSAVSGLLAERKLLDGELTDTTAKPIGRPKGAKNKTNGGVPAVQHQPFRVNEAPPIDGVIVIHVMVPMRQVPVVSAMLSGLGFPIQVGG